GVAAAEAAVDLLVGVQEERRPGEVVVEVEHVEVDAAHVDHTGEDELPREVGDLLVETNNLFVEALAVQSALAAEDEEDRLAAVAGGGPCPGVVGDPGGVLIVTREGRGGAKAEGQYEGSDGPGRHRNLLAAG